MLKFEFRNIIDGKYFFYYFPEGKKENAGLISVDFDKEDLDVHIEAPTDRAWYYANHLFNNLLDNYSKNDFPKSGTVAWC